MRSAWKTPCEDPGLIPPQHSHHLRPLFPSHGRRNSSKDLSGGKVGRSEGLQVACWQYSIKSASILHNNRLRQELPCKCPLIELAIVRSACSVTLFTPFSLARQEVRTLTQGRHLRRSPVAVETWLTWAKTFYLASEHQGVKHPHKKSETCISNGV